MPRLRGRPLFDMKDWDRKRRAEVLGAVVGNFLPLLGVLFFGWSLAGVVVIYWFENIVIGLVNILKLWTNRGEGSTAGGRVFLSIFFTVHYGMFTVGHGTFLEDLIVKTPGGLGMMVWEGLHTYHWAIGGFLVSHLWVFWREYLKGGERKAIPLQKVMFLPYPRVVVLHVAIIVGAGVTMIFQSPWFFVILLVVLKTALELGLIFKKKTLLAAPR